MMNKIIRENKSKFLTIMVLIIICATVVNYAIYSILDIYFDAKTVTEAYTGVQFNMIYTVIIIGVVTVLMLVLLPKESVNEMYKELEYDSDKDKRTPREILEDMIDEEIKQEEEKKL